MKYTDEELSMILSQHAVGGLARFGEHPSGSMLEDGGFSLVHHRGMCIEQVAHNHPNEWRECRDHGPWGYEGWAADWFDNSYERHMEPDELLRALEAAGLA